MLVSLWRILAEKVKIPINEESLQFSFFADYIGIADGVGGWRDRGFDPSVFSSSLMRICKDMANKKQEDPMRLIDDSYNKVSL